MQSRQPSGKHGPPVPPDVAQWRSNALVSLCALELDHKVRDHLVPLAPISSYFPDFLTPPTGLLGFTAGLDTVLSTPRVRIGRELDLLTSRSGAPSWGADLALGRAEALRTFKDTMEAYFAAALAPHWQAIEARVAVEHTRLAGVGGEMGVEGMLSGLRPVAVWHPHDLVLETAYPLDIDIHLDGRGITLVPSWFCMTAPVALVDPELPPVLVYPLAHDPLPKTDPNALAKLLGSSRARILVAITVGTPTQAILRRTGISASQLSRHAAVLRDNDLVTEARHAGLVYYTRTALGNALVAQRDP